MLAKSLSSDEKAQAEVHLAQILGVPCVDSVQRVRADKVISVVESLVPLRYNELTKMIEFKGKPIGDIFLQTLYLELAEEFKVEMCAKEVADAAVISARRHSFHPVRAYIAAIEDRLPEDDWHNLALRFYGLDDEWATLHLQRQLIACVARAFHPGCKLDTAFITHGRQGIGKSTQWSILGGDWFSDSLGDLRNIKDDKLCLHAAWIHEWGEIDSVVGKKESEQLKKFLSIREDLIRRPYGRGMELMPRGCAIVGTTNRDDFMKDHTGNRRFPIIRVDCVNNCWISENRDAIWGSAYEQMLSGVRYWYDDSEALRVSDDAKHFAAEDPIRDAVEAFFDGYTGVDFTMSQLAYFLNPEAYQAMSDGVKRENSRRLAFVCTSLGAKNTHIRERRTVYPGDNRPKQTIWLPPKKLTATIPATDDCLF